MARIVTGRGIAGRRTGTVRTAAAAARTKAGWIGRTALMALAALVLLTAGNLARGALEGGEADQTRLAAWDPALHNAPHGPAAEARIVPALRGAYD